MLLLAIEQSTETASVAILADGSVLAAVSWRDEPRHHQRFFHGIQEAARQACRRIAEVDVFAVGLGPGSYSGLRMALAAAQAMAMPGARAVFGVTSAEATAELAVAMRPLDSNAVTVVGDARRSRLWKADFVQAPGGGLRLCAPCGLVDAAELRAGIPHAARIVTADWEALAPVLRAACPPAAELVELPVVPDAATVGALAFRRIQAGTASEPLRPIYLHPPVLVAPRFLSEPLADAQAHGQIPDAPGA